MTITSMTIRGLIDEEGDTRTINVSAETLAFYRSVSSETVAAMSTNEFFFAALDYLFNSEDMDTDVAKIDTIYN